jgi:hypothetical protein
VAQEAPNPAVRGYVAVACRLDRDAKNGESRRLDVLERHLVMPALARATAARIGGEIELQASERKRLVAEEEALSARCDALAQGLALRTLVLVRRSLPNLGRRFGVGAGSSPSDHERPAHGDMVGGEAPPGPPSPSSRAWPSSVAPGFDV